MNAPDAVERVESPGSEAIERVIGRFTVGRPGPTLICIAGLHGNEPAGVEALRHVFARLTTERPPINGTVVGLAGNLPALRARARYIDEDLNRIWHAARLSAVQSGLTGAVEDQQLRELSDTLEDLLAEANTTVYVLDLHTTSAYTAPFVVIGDTLRNRRFAQQFPAPMVLGLEEQIGGTLADFLSSRGTVTVGFEAGRHDAAASVERCAAAVWIAQSAAGLLDPGSPIVGIARETVRNATAGLPRVVEIRHRHAVSLSDGFQMQPGLANFQPVRRGQTLAVDQRGTILAPTQGLLLLPLYQLLGDDGFFIARAVRPFWLRMSAFLRRLGLARWIHVLPGVRRDPADERNLLVNPRVARWAAIQLFHLLGYRRQRSRGSVLVFARRAGDRKAGERSPGLKNFSEGIDSANRAC